MDFTDQTLVCATCGQPFSFTAREQAFYRDKGFQHTPKRCRDCRRAKRAMQPDNGDGLRHGSGNGNGPRPSTYSAVCSACGAEVELSFKPDGVRPVYWRPCFDERRRQPRA